LSEGTCAWLVKDKARNTARQERVILLLISKSLNGYKNHKRARYNGCC